MYHGSLIIFLSWFIGIIGIIILQLVRGCIPKNKSKDMSILSSWIVFIKHISFPNPCLDLS